MHLQENTSFDIDLGSHETLSSTLHQLTHAPAKFEVATHNTLAGDAFTRKYITCI